MRRKIYNRKTKKAAARRVILSKLFGKFYCISGWTVESAKEAILPFKGVIAAQIRYLNEIDYYGGDFRSGASTYGYDSDEKILGNLCYISDRYNCAYRLTWVYDLITQK